MLAAAASKEAYRSFVSACLNEQTMAKGATMDVERIRLDPKETALIMVDMQNDFCHPEGFYAKHRDRMTSIGLDPDLVAARIGSMDELLRAARKSGLFIVHTQLVREPDPFNGVQTLHSVVPRTYRAYKDAPGPPPLAPGNADKISEFLGGGKQ